MASQAAPSFLSRLWQWPAIALLYAYFFGAVLSAPYFNWRYARENGVASWMFFGEIAATAKAVVWPYYTYAAFTQRSRDDLTDAEQTSLTHWLRAMDSSSQAARILNSSKAPSESEMNAVSALFKVAFDESQKVDVKSLAIIHAEMPAQFSTNYIEGLRIMASIHEESRTQADLSKGIKLLDTWSDWLDLRRKDLHFPKSLESVR